MVTKTPDLGYGHCRLAVATRMAGGLKRVEDLSGKKVAASMSVCAREFFRKRNVDAKLLEVTGSVEIMVALGLADAIVDLVELHNMLRDNGLGTENVLQVAGGADPDACAARPALRDDRAPACRAC